MNAQQPEPRSVLESGTRLGRYVVLGLIGHGSLLDVYSGKLFGEHGFQKDVALKIPSLACTADALDDLVTRAKRSIALSHANILGVIDLGRAAVGPSELTFLVTERARGAALDAIVRRSAERGLALPLGCVMRLGAEIAKALDHGHRRPQPLAHGALRESKVFVTPEGQLKIGDFGLESAAVVPADGAPRADLAALASLLGRLMPVTGGSASADAFTAAAETLLGSLVDGSIADAAVAHDRLLELSFAISPERDGRALERLLDCFAEASSTAAVMSEVAASVVHDSARSSAEAETGRAPAALGRFVGRSDELLAIAVALNETLTRGAERQAVTGPDGIGKTRLVRELARRVPAERVRSLFVQCSHSLAQVPLGAIAVAVRALSALPETGPLDADDVARSLTALGREAAEIKSLARVLAVPFVSDCRALPVHEALLGLIASASGGLPMVIAFDDAHELDPVSDSILAAMVESERARTLPLLVLLVQPSIDAEHAASRGALSVAELDDDDIAQLLANRLGARVIPPELFELVVARAGGHPLFIEALVRELVAGAFVEVRAGVAHLAPGPLPPFASDLAQAARDKVQALPLALQQALSALAVVGDGASLALLTATLDVAPEIAEAAAAQLEAHGLLRRGEHGLLFVAGIYRDAALALLAAAEQSSAHLRLAHALRAEQSDAQSAARLVQAAEHFRCAGEKREAAAAFCGAARAFESLGAFDAAAGLFARALPELDRADEAARSLEALTRLAERANLAALDIEEGLGNALALSDQALDKDARIALRARLAVALARHRSLELADVLLDQAEAMSAPVLAAIVVSARLAVAARACDPLRAKDALELFEKELSVAGTPALESWLDAIDVALLAGDSVRARSLLSIMPESDATLAERARVLGCYAALALCDGELSAASALLDKAIALATLEPASGELAKLSLERALCELDGATPDRPRAFSRLSEAHELARRAGELACSELALSELEALEKGPLARAAIELRAERAEAQGRGYDALRLAMLVAKRLYGRDPPALEALALRANGAGLGGLARLARMWAGPATLVHA